MLGAGDIKLLGAIGSIMGPEFIFYASIYSFISGGIIALFIMLIRKNVNKRIKYIYNYIKDCFLTFSVKPYNNRNIKDDGAIFRFSYAIFIGTILAISNC
jgi:prepilin peptidase CpaA